MMTEYSIVDYEENAKRMISQNRKCPSYTELRIKIHKEISNLTSSIFDLIR